MKPSLIKGNCYNDERGNLRFNNDFDSTMIKRIYFIENANINFERAWQGHKIEQRWFSAIQGKFLIKLIEIDNWDTPNNDLQSIDYELNSECLDILHIPAGFITYIKAIEENSKLMVLADYIFGEVNDEYRFPLDYFKR